MYNASQDPEVLSTPPLDSKAVQTCFGWSDESSFLACLSHRQVILWQLLRQRHLFEWSRSWPLSSSESNPYCFSVNYS